MNAPNAGVEDAAEPHNQPDDAGGVHGRGLGVALPVSDGSQILRSKCKYLNTGLERHVNETNVLPWQQDRYCSLGLAGWTWPTQ